MWNVWALKMIYILNRISLREKNRNKNIIHNKRFYLKKYEYFLKNYFNIYFSFETKIENKIYLLLNCKIFFLKLKEVEKQVLFNNNIINKTLFIMKNKSFQ